MSAAAVIPTNHGSTETRSNRTIVRHVLFVTVALIAGCGGNNSPTTPSTTSTTMSETWSSTVAPAGQSSRSFTVSASGTINVTLTTAGATLGVGVGLPRVSGGGCRLGVSVNASAGTAPQIS